LRNQSVALIFAIERLRKRPRGPTRTRDRPQSTAQKTTIMRRDVFQAIADPTRRAILGLLALQAMTPNAIAEHFDSSRQAISKHIQILAECKLVKQEQTGREIHYHYNPQKMKELDIWMEQLRAAWEARFTQLDDVLKNLKTKKS
jgi:DNA-binding transcriptional ArsR family regulator